MTRVKLQAHQCDFRDDRESNGRVLEQFIAGIRHTELQKELLSTAATAQDFTTEQAVERGRTYEASIPHEIPTRPRQVVVSDLFYFDCHDHVIVADCMLLKLSNCVEDSHGKMYQPDCIESH